MNKKYNFSSVLLLEGNTHTHTHTGVTTVLSKHMHSMPIEHVYVVSKLRLISCICNVCVYVCVCAYYYMCV